MAINIYDELALQAAKLAAIEAVLKQHAETLAKLASPPEAAPKLRVAPVTYFRKDYMWQAVLDAKPALAMINPGNGPGPDPDSLYVGLVPKCRAAGIPVFGYVHTKYGIRPLAEVKADVLNHKQWYGVSGIFVDTTSRLDEHLPYYRELCAYIRSKGCMVVLNPGTKGPE